MNTALGDLHEDLVTLEDNEIIDTPEHSTHSSPQSSSHGEEEHEEDGIEDVEAYRKRWQQISPYRYAFRRRNRK